MLPPLFYDGTFGGSTATGAPGTTTGTADVVAVGTPGQWSDLSGFLWLTQSGLLGTVVAYSNGHYDGALARPEVSLDQYAQVTTVPGTRSFWALYLRFQANPLAYYGFSLNSGGILQVRMLSALGEQQVLLTISIPGWDATRPYDLGASALGMTPTALVVWIRDALTHHLVYTTNFNVGTPIANAQYDLPAGSYALGENSTVSGGPYSRVRLYGNTGPPPAIYQTVSEATVLIGAFAFAIGPPRTYTVTSGASVVIRATGSATGVFPVNATASMVITATAKIGQFAQAQVIVSATASSTVAYVVEAGSLVVISADAEGAVPRRKVRISQLVLEALVPFVDLGLIGNAGAQVIVSATASASKAAFAFTVTATSSVIITATATSVHVLPLHQGFAQVIVLAVGDAVNTDGGGPIRRVVGAAQVIVSATAGASQWGRPYGDEYLGRFQQGEEVLLQVLVHDVHNSPVDPLVTPAVRIYALDMGRRIETAQLAHLRYARIGQVYALPLRLDVRYPGGRYGVFYQAPGATATGLSLALFEVVSGGDMIGPVIVAQSLSQVDGDALVAQTGSGTLLVGTKAVIS